MEERQKKELTGSGKASYELVFQHQVQLTMLYSTWALEVQDATTSFLPLLKITWPSFP